MDNFEKLREWYRLGRYREFVETRDKEVAWDNIQHRIQHRRHVSLWRTWGGIAAMFVVMAGAAVWYAHTNDMTQGFIAAEPATTAIKEASVLSRTCQNCVHVKAKGSDLTLTVPMGAEYTDTMPDGTSIAMNASTVLHYNDRNSDRREVDMTGEAYFAVTRNEQKPFVVNTPVGQIEVLGTHFNVAADKETTIVTLEEGSVRLHFSDRYFTMKPGEQARIHANGTFDVRHVNTTNYTSWSTGTYEFNNASLDEIMRQLSLWYNVNITIADKSLEDTRYTGIIMRSETLESAINTLSLISDLKFKVKGNEIKVTSM